MFAELVNLVGLVGSARTTTMSSSESKSVGEEGARKVEVRRVYQDTDLSTDHRHQG